MAAAVGAVIDDGAMLAFGVTVDPGVAVGAGATPPGAEHEALPRLRVKGTVHPQGDGHAVGDLGGNRKTRCLPCRATLLVVHTGKARGDG